LCRGNDSIFAGAVWARQIATLQAAANAMEAGIEAMIGID
jgi:hypothetical protein